MKLYISISDEKPGPWRPRCLPGLRIAGRISISDEKPGPWRLDRARHNRVEVANFNLRREARPLATSCGLLYPALVGLFQSQTRSQAPGDAYPRRAEPFSIAISISDEKPGPWRRRQQIAAQMGGENFNLRREARPLATTPTTPYPLAVLAFQSQTRSQAPGDITPLASCCFHCSISISDEKPGPWRRNQGAGTDTAMQKFQSQTRSQAPGDIRVRDR